MATKVREIMTSNPICMASTDAAADAAAQMRDADVGAILVEKDGKICGILTDRDLVVRAMADRGDAGAMTLGNLCTRNVLSVASDDDADQALEVMRKHAVRRVPVIDSGRAVGILSLGDIAVERDSRSVLGELSAAPPNR